MGYPYSIIHNIWLTDQYMFFCWETLDNNAFVYNDFVKSMLSYRTLSFFAPAPFTIGI